MVARSPTGILSMVLLCVRGYANTVMVGTDDRPVTKLMLQRSMSLISWISYPGLMQNINARPILILRRWIAH